MIYLGLSAAGSVDSAEKTTGPVGLFRSFSHWGSASNEAVEIRANQAKGRLTWISYDPPVSTSGIWAKIGSGAYDADIRARAQRYASYRKPVISTFHHEPHNEGGDPLQWAAAYSHIYDVMDAETGLKNVTFAPIIGEWEFNPYNRNRRPEKFVTKAVIERMPFFGVDLYQTANGEGFSTRLARVLDFLEYHGADDPMVGIGETGCCLAEDPQPQTWLQANWDWAVTNVDHIGAMSYFDSTRNSRDARVWLLDETKAKTATYKGLLASGKATTLG